MKKELISILEISQLELTDRDILENVNSNYINYLIELSKSGRRNSFMELCKLNIDMVYPMVLRLAADLILARQLTIDIFISAWDNLKHHRADVPFHEWLKGITVYMTLEELRTKERKKKIDKLLKEKGEKIKPKQPGSKNKLESMIFNLEQSRRVIVVLHDMEGYSCQEISDFLGETSCKKINESLKVTRRELMAKMK